MKQNNDSPNTPFRLGQGRTCQKLQVRGIPTTQQTSSSHIIHNQLSIHTTPLFSKFTFTPTTIPFRDENDWHQVELELLFCHEKRREKSDDGLSQEIEVSH